jgi:hypothetical protein
VILKVSNPRTGSDGGGERGGERAAAAPKDNFDRVALLDKHASVAPEIPTSKTGAGDAGYPATLDTSHGGLFSSVHDKSDKPAETKGDVYGKVMDEHIKESEKFAFGDPLMNKTDERAAKGKLEGLVTDAYLHGGEQGVKDLAGQMSRDAVDKFGESAFDKAPAQFNDSLALEKVTPNPDGSTQVQMDFAQPGSSDTQRAVFNVPKPEVENPRPSYFTGVYTL